MLAVHCGASWAPTHQSREAKIPKPKSTFQAEPQESADNGPQGHELDPLIDALLEHLPAPGDPFPPEDRKLWMQILDLILKLIHPDAEPNEPGNEQQPEQPGQPEPRR